MFWCIPPQLAEQFKAAINTISRTYQGQMFASDMLITLLKNTTFLWDPKFAEAVQSTAGDDEERGIVWRMHTTTWAARHALTLPGDFVECGVYRGLSAAVICKYLDFASVPKTFFLYDTFAGLPDETSTEQERQMHAHYKQIEPQQWVDQVRQKFVTFPNVRIVKGIVPYSFEEAMPQVISFLHIDMNSAQAEIMALERLFDRVTPGGIIVLDDFGWTTQRPQTVAELEFMKQRGHSILELPTGQGMIIKH
jgi:hypothetical protein